MSRDLRVLLGVPPLVEERVVGVPHAASLGDREFTGEETNLLQLAAELHR